MYFNNLCLHPNLASPRKNVWCRHWCNSFRSPPKNSRWLDIPVCRENASKKRITTRDGRPDRNLLYFIWYLRCNRNTHDGHASFTWQPKRYTTYFRPARDIVTVTGKSYNLRSVIPWSSETSEASRIPTTGSVTVEDRLRSSWVFRAVCWRQAGHPPP